MRKTPTLREVLAGYKQFNAWEVAEQNIAAYESLQEKGKGI
jgi:hypothetical protein